MISLMFSSMVRAIEIGKKHVQARNSYMPVVTVTCLYVFLSNKVIRE